MPPRQCESNASVPHKAEYLLLTAAYNEEAYIEETIRSVVAQALRPRAWVIVSDGSTDRTDEIVKQYAKGHSFIRLVRREKDENRRFASKVFALRAGLQSLDLEAALYIGHLDADMCLDPSYFRDLLQRFEEDPQLGIAGGWYLERVGDELKQAHCSTTSVPGSIQMFRRECYQDIGEWLPIEQGGEDSYAQIMARLRGWRVRSFSELKTIHNRRLVAGSKLRYCYRQGFMDFALGSHPLLELVRVARRVFWRPYIIGGLARLSGFVIAHVCGKRMAPPELIAFLRKEQMSKLLARAGFINRLRL